jgi:hypothetical protein
MPKSGAPYRLDVYRQPVVAPDDVTTTLALASGWRTTNGSRTQVTAQRLQSDAVIEIPVHRH